MKLFRFLTTFDLLFNKLAKKFIGLRSVEVGTGSRAPMFVLEARINSMISNIFTPGVQDF
jgi:hypothetical protein